MKLLFFTFRIKLTKACKQCIAYGDGEPDEAVFEVAPSPNDIKNQLKSVHIQIDTSTEDSIFFTAQNCSTYITHYVIDYAPQSPEVCSREIVPCNHAGRYRHTMCQSEENIMFSIIPVLESNRAITRNSKPIQRRYWTAAGQADFENIRPEIHGLAMGILSSLGPYILTHQYDQNLVKLFYHLIHTNISNL